MFQVGFSGGPLYLSVPGARTPGVLTLHKRSNCACLPAGRWMYRVDQDVEVPQYTGQGGGEMAAFSRMSTYLIY